MVLLFFWLPNVAVAIDRVKSRVSKGGHNIPEDVIRRRYDSGISNLKTLFLPRVDEWIVFENAELSPHLVAKSKEGIQEILLPFSWNKIINHGKN